MTKGKIHSDPRYIEVPKYPAPTSDKYAFPGGWRIDAFRNDRKQYNLLNTANQAEADKPYWLIEIAEESLESEIHHQNIYGLQPFSILKRKTLPAGTEVEFEIKDNKGYIV